MTGPYDIPMSASPLLLAVATVAAVVWLLCTGTLVMWFVWVFRPRPLDAQARMEFWLKYHLRFRQVVSDPKWTVEED